MITINELKKITQDGTRFLEKKQGVKEVEVFASANVLNVLRIAYCSNIPSNGLEEPKSIEDFGLSVRVLFSNGKTGFGKENSSLSMEAVKKAFEKADGAISDIFKEPDKVVSVSPSLIDLPQDSVETVQFYISNFESDVLNVKAKVRSSSKFITWRFADTLSEESKDYKLGSGKQIEITLIVEEKGGPLGVNTCNAEVCLLVLQ